jgi:hypothetical protein
VQGGDQENQQYATTFCLEPAPHIDGVVGRVTFTEYRDGYAAALLGGKPAVAHLHGTTWRIEHLVKPPGKASNIYGVAATAPADAWAAGAAYPGEKVWAVGGTGNRQGAAIPLRMLAERWDGHRWISVPIPTPGQSENGLLGVAIAAPNSVWTFGQLDSGPPFVACRLRW